MLLAKGARSADRRACMSGAVNRGSFVRMNQIILRLCLATPARPFRPASVHGSREAQTAFLTLIEGLLSGPSIPGGETLDKARQDSTVAFEIA